MGFSIDVVADILKFPSPLFPKYKNSIPVGLRYDIPALAQDFDFNIVLPVNRYELKGVVFSSTGYKDQDFFDVTINNVYILNSVYTKELAQQIDLSPIAKFSMPKDVVVFTFHNTSGTSKVIWVDLLLTASSPIQKTSQGVASSTQASPLEYFVAGSDDPQFIDPKSIDTTYWYPGMNMDGVAIRTPFWEGRNDLLSSQHMTDDIVNPSDFYKYLFYFVQKRKSGFENSVFNQTFKAFKTSATKSYSQYIGLDLHGLSTIQLAEIYLSYWLQVPAIIFNSFNRLATSTEIDSVLQYLDFKKFKCLDWIEFSSKSDPDSQGIISGFCIHIGGNDSDKYIKSFIKIDPVCSSLDFSRYLNPRQYYFNAGSTSYVNAIFTDVVEHDPFFKYQTLYLPDNLSFIVTMLHELAHGIDQYYKRLNGKYLAGTSDWLSIAGWDLDYFVKYSEENYPLLLVRQFKSEQDNDYYEPPISNYGCRNPREDFAETYVYYTMYREFVQNEFPKRFQFMQSFVDNFMGSD